MTVEGEKGTSQYIVTGGFAEIGESLTVLAEKALPREDVDQETYEALGLCPQGGAQKYIGDGDNTYGGRHVANPSGGLLSKGHPLGATGLAQCYELTRQLRGRAEATQVDGARVALQHNLGLGGACVVTLYKAA